MKTRFLVDENLSPKTVVFLRTLGYDAKLLNEVGLQGAADEKIAEFALANNLVIVTLDEDFGQVYYFSSQAAGTIVIRLAEPTVEKINSALAALLKQVGHARLQKSLVILGSAGYRILEK